MYKTHAKGKRERLKKYNSVKTTVIELSENGSDRAFSFAFFAAMLLLFGLGMLLTGYAPTSTSPDYTCVGSSLHACPTTITTPAHFTLNFYVGAGLTILGACSAILSFRAHFHEPKKSVIVLQN